MSYTNDAKKEFDKRSMELIAQEILGTTNEIYFLGNGNRVTLNFIFPQKIENLTLHHVNLSGEEYDFFNISYYGNDFNYDSIIVLPEEMYIRINCTYCHHSPNVDGNWVSWYNRSDFNEGPKKVRLESKGDWVSIDFVK